MKILKYKFVCERCHTILKADVDDLEYDLLYRKYGYRCPVCKQRVYIEKYLVKKVYEDAPNKSRK